MRKFTDNNVSDIIQTFLQTKSLTQTSKKFKTTNEKIKSILISKAGITYFSKDMPINEKTKKMIIEDYTINNVPVKEITRKYGMHKSTLTNKLRKWGIEPNRANNSGKPGKRKFTKEQEKQICKLYLEKFLSTWDLGYKYKMTNHGILKILRRNNVKLRNRSIAARKYELDEKYFEIIDTSEKAYFLGLIYAEGHVEKEGRNTLTLGLQSEDDYILNFFKKEVKSTRPLENRKLQEKYFKPFTVLRLSSIKYTKDLEKLGIKMEHKCFDIEFPKFLNNKLLLFFILGYFDGDGHVGIYNRHLSCGFTGNPKFITGLKDYLLKLKIKSCMYYNNEHTCRLQLAQYEALKLFKNIYKKEIKIFMKRKFQIFLDLCILKKSFYDKNYNIKNIKKMKLLKDCFHSFQEIKNK